MGTGEKWVLVKMGTGEKWVLHGEFLAPHPGEGAELQDRPVLARIKKNYITLYMYYQQE